MAFFCKIKQIMGPTCRLVPSHKVSLQKSVWHSHSNRFCSLSLLLLHFFSFTQSSPFSLNLYCSSTSHHHHTNCHHHKPPPQAIMRSVRAQPRSGLRFLSLSLHLMLDQFLSQSFFISLIPFARLVHLYV